MARLTRLALLTIVGQLIASTSGQSCYRPGGVLSTTEFPCYPNAGTSLCCPMGWTCFSNNLCIATDDDALGTGIPIGTAIRGGCTNQAGDNDLCGDYCLEAPNDSLISCGGSTFCCGSKAAQGLCNCDTKEGTFQAEGGTAKTIMGQTGMAQTATVASSTATSGSSSNTATSTTLSTSTISGTASTTSVDPSNTAAAATSSAATQTAESTSQPFTKKIGFKVLIAVLALAVFAFIVAAVVIVLRRRKRREEGDYVVPGRSNDSSMVDLNHVPPPPKDFSWRERGPYDPPRPFTDSPAGGTSGSSRVTDRAGNEGEIERPPPDPEAETWKRPPPMASVPVRPYEGT